VPQPGLALSNFKVCAPEHLAASLVRFAQLSDSIVIDSASNTD
jgi:hypothetical protein